MQRHAKVKKMNPNKQSMQKRQAFMQIYIAVAVGSLSAMPVQAQMQVQGRQNGLGNLMIPIDKDLEVGVIRNSNETAGVAALTLSGESVGLRLVIDKSAVSQHAMAAVGIPFNRGYILGGYSVGREPIIYPNINDDMKGSSAFVKLNINQPISGIRKITLDGLSQRTQSKNLSVVDKAFTDVSVTDVGNYTTRTTTTTGFDRTSLYFNGGNLDRVSLGAEADVSENGILSLQGYHTQTRLLGVKDAKTSFQAGYMHYFASPRANASISADTEGQVSLGAQKNFADNPFSLHMGAYKNTKGAKDGGIRVGVRYAFGAEAGKIESLGVRPQAVSTQKTQTQLLNGLYNPRDYFGLVIEKKERIITGQSINDQVNAPPDIPVPPRPPEPPTCPTKADSPTTSSISHTDNFTPIDYMLPISGQSLGSTTVRCNAADADGITGTCTYRQQWSYAQGVNAEATNGYGPAITWPINETRVIPIYMYFEANPFVYDNGFTLTINASAKNGATCTNTGVNAAEYVQVVVVRL
jgi:hypothetical protein